MDDEVSLLGAIRRDPGDALAWLALADLLEESGQSARAELSRLTRRACALAPDDITRPGIEQRITELLRAGERPCLPELVNSLGTRFVMVPPGVGMMGAGNGDAGRRDDEDPRHAVEYTAPYFIAAWPVTQAEYRAVTGAAPSAFCASGPSGGMVRGLDTSRFPVDSVSWEDATMYCRRLSRMPAEERAGRRYRLPTEAEWEFACRASGAVSGTFVLGDSLASDVANFDGVHPYGGAETGPALGRPCAVGHYPPNPLGLFDLLGNVWEWVEDWFAPGYETWPRIAPHGPPSGTSRVLRGGSWSSYGWGCRIAYRNCIGPNAANRNFGLRPVLTIQDERD